MKKFRLLFLLTFFSTLVYAQEPTFQWAKSIKGKLTNTPTNMIVDDMGNTYTVGLYQDTTDFDLGINVFNLYTSMPFYKNIYIIKLDANGDLLWAKYIGVNNYNFWQNPSITKDNLGNIFISGNFWGTVDFDPGIGVNNLSNYNEKTTFILKLNTNGDFVWVSSIYSTGNNYPISIKSDSIGNIYGVGYFDSTLYINSNTLTPDSLYNYFIAKWDTSGNCNWAKKINGTITLNNYPLEIDRNAAIIVTGSMNGNVDFDPSVNTYILEDTLNNFYTTFILKLDSSGSFIWAKNTQVNYNSNSIGVKLITDTNNNIYLTGQYTGIVDFDPDTNTNNLQSVGPNNMFILKLNSNGNYNWCKSISNNFINTTFQMINDKYSNLYLTGSFSNVCDFDPGISTNNLTATGNNDIFILKLNQNGDFNWVRKLDDGITNSIVLDDSNNVYLVGSFWNTLDFNTGIDTFFLSTMPSFNGNNSQNSFIMKMKQCNQTIDTLDIHTCSNYILNGQTYANSGIYYQSYLNSTLCDSIILLNLHIDTSFKAIWHSTCSYTATINGITYYNNGVYYQTLINSKGCDSTLFIGLILGSYINTLTSVNGNYISSNNVDSSATFQWLKCNPFSLISGATNKDYIALTNGNYAVIVSQYGCSDTSNCVEIKSLNINNHLNNNLIKIAPNPTTDKITISIENEFKNAKVKIFSSTGEIILEKKNINGKNLEIDLSNYSSGFYLAEIFNENVLYRTKINKE